MDERLRRAACEGQVSDLYRLIQRDGNVLRRISEVEFIDTPLHIAADSGCVDFAMEIMNLKPLFARVLNQDGLSPMHIAVGKGHRELVLNLMENAKDLVRVKGKKGETPLHHAITRDDNSEVLLLPRFLEECPESIRDVTTENETALHLAVRNNKYEALRILCNMLRKTDYCQDVVNQKDRNGNTALHIAARDNRYEMIKQLLKCKADNYATNLAGSTSLDVAQEFNNGESISILQACFIQRVSPSIYQSQKQILKHVTKASATLFQDMDNISSEDRNALLVILALLLTVTFQAGLSPPGSVWQSEGSSDSTTTEGNIEKSPGKSVMSQTDFLVFSIPTCAVFIVAFFLTLVLLKPFPRGFRIALQVLLSFLAICFVQSISFLAPTHFASKTINFFLTLAFLLMMFMCISSRVSKISVSILGYWLFPIYYLPIGNAIRGCLLFLFLYDELWQGWLLVVGYCSLVALADGALIAELLILLESWLFLCICRFCLNWYNESCDACTFQ